MKHSVTKIAIVTMLQHENEKETKEKKKRNILDLEMVYIYIYHLTDLFCFFLSLLKHKEKEEVYFKF